MNEKEKDVNKKMNSEAQLTTFEAISMIVGNSIGTGIIAVPYLAVRNSMWDVVWMVAFAYIVNVILHLIIAELSYNNGGVQLVKSFEGELFHGKMKKIFSWIMFVVYGLAIMVGVSGNINGGAQIFVNWFGLPLWAAQLIYYFIAGSVVFMGMKAVGIAQKYSVALLLVIVAVMTAGTFLHPRNTLYTAPFHINNLLALYSMVVFATSANQAVIQVVKGLNGDSKRIRKTIFTGFGLSSLFVLVVTLTVLLGTKGAVDKELDCNRSLYSVCHFRGEQLYCTDENYERSCGIGKYYAGSHLWKVEEKGGKQSDLRHFWNGSVSGADDGFYDRLCGWRNAAVEMKA